MPSLRGARSGSGVVSRHKRAPRSEGVPPSIGSPAWSLPGQDALAPGRPARLRRCLPAQACSTERGRPALDWVSRVVASRARRPRSGAPSPAPALSPGTSVLHGARASRPRLGIPRGRFQGKTPSLRGAQPGSGVVSRHKRAPRSEGVPPSIGSSAWSVRGQDPFAPGHPSDRGHLALDLKWGKSSKPGYLPMQKVAKMLPKRSSGVVSPVISPSAWCARRSSSAMTSAAALPSRR